MPAPPRLDVFREPHDGGTWICRRDPRLVRRYAELIQRTAAGIPYAPPEVALLFKARHHEVPKNEHDFAGAAPLLPAAARDWLVSALQRIAPGHPWLARLEPLE